MFKNFVYIYDFDYGEGYRLTNFTNTFIFVGNFYHAFNRIPGLNQSQSNI